MTYGTSRFLARKMAIQPLILFMSILTGDKGLKKKNKIKIKYDPQYLKSGVAVSNWISNPAVGLSFKGLSTTGPSC